jgi:hypothetical protein
MRVSVSWTPAAMARNSSQLAVDAAGISAGENAGRLVKKSSAWHGLIKASVSSNCRM